MIDFKAITGQTTRYNFHTHTQFCDGRAPMQQFVEAALTMGFEHLGFTPHSPISFPTSCNMTREDVPTYFDEIERLRELSRGKLHIYQSMEIDYVDDSGPADDYFQHLPLDYRMASVHFIPSLTEPGTWVDIDGHFERFKQRMAEHFNNDIRYVVRTFFKQSMKMVNAGGFDIIGHFDKIAHNAGDYEPGIDDTPWFEQQVRELFDNVMDHHLIVEVNTKAYGQCRRFFPASKWFSLLKQYHAPVLVNSDCHVPALLNAGREEALQLLG